MVEKIENAWTIALGVLVLVGLVYFVISGVYWIYVWVSPQAAPSAISIALSAYFESGAAGARTIRVKGTVIENNQPAKQGRVKLAVELADGSERQTVYLPLREGQFDSSGEAALATFQEAAGIHVIAEFNTGKATAVEHLYLKSSPAVLETTALWIMAAGTGLLLFAFFWLFTGDASPHKNQAAIVFSYAVMLAFLAIPLVLPYVFASMFPQVVYTMRKAPVGFLVATPRGLEPQWVLNLGGVPVTKPAATAQNSQEKAGEASPAQTAATPTPGAPSTEGQKPSPPVAPAATTRESNVPEGVTDLQGGLVIPLFVIILSVIGGAINMTRNLPRFQKEAASLETPLTAVKQLGQRVVSSMEMMGIARKDPPNQAAEETSGTTQTEPASTAAEADQTEDSGESTPSGDLVKMTAKWREDLITQHMYLISAPFLAIAVYYLLQWLDMVKVPALVLVSFSVGLISEQILGSILKVSRGIVDQGGDGNPPVKP